jgi:hypothetical protein
MVIFVCLLIYGLWFAIYSRPSVDLETFKARSGWTKEEVLKNNPKPWIVIFDNNGREKWIYYTDRTRLGLACIGVVFDHQGKVLFVYT